MNNELLKQCKDDIAQKHGHGTWALAEYRTSRYDIDKMLEEVVDLYSSRQLSESLEAYNRECKRVDELTEDVAVLQSRLKSEYERGYNQGMVVVAKETD